MSRSNTKASVPMLLVLGLGVGLGTGLGMATNALARVAFREAGRATICEILYGPNVLKHSMINRAVGESTIADALKNYEKHRDLYVEFSPYNQNQTGLSLLTHQPCRAHRASQIRF